MALGRNERRWAWVGAAALTAAMVAGLYVAWSHWRDRQLASEVETAVVQKLLSLPAHDSIIDRYGSFMRLEDGRFETRVSDLGLPTLPMVLERRAVFDKAWAQLTIVVHRGEKLEVERVTMQPDQPGPNVHAAIEGGEMWITDARGSKTRSQLWIGVRHPRCPQP